MARLANKVALITGASSGIGAAAAELFAAEGAPLFLVDLPGAALESVAARCGGVAFSADVTDPAAMRAAVDAALARFGRVDVFLPNAGVLGPILPLADYPLAEFDRVLAVNLRAVFAGLQMVLPVMAQQGRGSAVLTASIGGLKARGSGNSAYIASKHGIVGLTSAAAVEYAARGVRVNCVCPGPIDTPMLAAIERLRTPDDPTQTRRQLQASVPMQRYGGAHEVARLMLFLASDEAAYCTGGTYTVDGGVSAI